MLRRPDVFAAAIAGAPTTDERLYDTCYSERYLGDPNTNAAVYEANNVIPLAPQLSKPLMIIHGLADDNVYVAHSLRLSSALLAAGKPHEFVPLSGMTHMANSEVVAENLLLLQVDFLRRALKIRRTGKWFDAGMTDVGGGRWAQESPIGKAGRVVTTTRGEADRVRSNWRSAAAPRCSSRGRPSPSLKAPRSSCVSTLGPRSVIVLPWADPKDSLLDLSGKD